MFNKIFRTSSGFRDNQSTIVTLREDFIIFSAMNNDFTNIPDYYRMNNFGFPKTC
jgi:hypothetical protein